MAYKEIPETIKRVVSPYRFAIIPEIVYSPVPYILLATTNPKRGKAIAAPRIPIEAAIPDVKACCAEPTVEALATTSDIMTAPTTAVGNLRDATINWSLVFPLSRRPKKEVIKI
jgi:hypothetical protein